MISHYIHLFAFPAEYPREGEIVVAWQTPIMKSLAFSYYPDIETAQERWPGVELRESTA